MSSSSRRHRYLRSDTSTKTETKPRTETQPRTITQPVEPYLFLPDVEYSDVISELHYLATSHYNNNREFVWVLQSLENVNKYLGPNDQTVLTNLLLQDTNYCECVKYMAFSSIQPYANFKLREKLRKIPMLTKHSHETARLVKHECVIILSMAFFNIFSKKYKNFNFQLWKQSEPEKLKAFFNYISRMINASENHKFLEVKYHRNSYKNELNNIINDIKNSSKHVEIKNKLGIQTDPNDAIENQNDTVQAVFAHAYIGGRTLSDGYGQEEIRFCISPECIIIMLLCYNEPMKENECISIDGAERFSEYTMKNKQFVCGDPYVDKTPKRANTETLDIRIIAFNALNYGPHNANARVPDDQYKITNINRDIIKLSSVFKTILNFKHPANILASGNWGVGEFQNTKMLKFYLQFLVASYYGVTLNYIIPGDTDLHTITQNIYTSFAQTTDQSVKTLYKFIIDNIHRADPRKELRFRVFG